MTEVGLVNVFTDHCQTWWGHSLGDDIGWVRSKGTRLVKCAHNEPIHYFNLFAIAKVIYDRIGLEFTGYGPIVAL